MNDRIRAKPPNKNDAAWRKGEITEISQGSNEVSVTVNPLGSEGEILLKVTKAIYDLFTGRLDSKEVVGSTVYFRQKGD